MKEYLTIGNSKYSYIVVSSEIWYITSGINCSVFFLTNGKQFSVRMPLCDVKKEIDTHFKETHNVFRRIGEGLIINMDYLFKINKSEKEIELLNRRADGFMDGYSAGYNDAILGIKPVNIKLKSNTVTSTISERVVDELYDEFSSKKEKKRKNGI